MRFARFASLLTLAALAGDARPAAPPPATDGHDLVLLHGRRPYRLRLRLRVGGRPFRAGWGRGVEGLFASLDRDGDGTLSRAEAAAAPSPAQWRQLAAGQAVDPDGAPAFADLAGGRAAVSRDSFRAFYRDSVAGPLRPVWAWRTRPATPLSDALWKRLDADGDGRLTRREVGAARRTLRPVNQDEERVGPAELVGPPDYAGPSLGAASAHDAPAGMPFFSLRPGHEAALAARLLAAYDRDRSGRLSRAEVGLPREAFDRLDRDGDGTLDARELAGWPGLPADGEVAAWLDGSRPTRVTLPPGSPLRAETTRNGVALFVADVVLDVHVQVETPGSGARPVPGAAAFSELDRDADGYLDSRELQRPPFSHVAWLRLADLDGDGRVSRAEFDAFSRLQRGLMTGVTLVRVEDGGASLFRLLDRDGDGLLGPRELASAWGRLAPYADGRGAVARAALPRVYRVVVGHARRGAWPRFEAAGPAPPLRPLARGPGWFCRMDRNGDGDVSRAEWLGPADLFRRIDADGDGLISLDEAWRADRLFRRAAAPPQP